MLKMLTVLKKNLSSLLFLVIGIIFLFSTEAKAYLQQGLMKVGFFQPKLEQPILNRLSQISPKDYLDFQLINEKGEMISLADLKGKVVFLNFWAIWCPPCIAEMPSIQILNEKFKNDDEVVILTVEIEGKQDRVNQFLTRKNLNIPVYFPNSSIPSALFKGDLPTTIILDKEGNIAHTTIGLADYSGKDIVNFLNEVKAMHP
jgi:thiol-disulfide isomerase/thioredoxin